jgi:pimeloyl-ACP methyl ester carboxylesterase
MALQRPERVSGVVLAAGSLALEGGRKPNPLLHYPPARRWIKVLSTRLMLNEDNVAKLIGSAYGRPVTATELAGYFAPLTVAGSDAVLVDLQSRSAEPINEGIGQLERPVLCIWGEDDSWVPLEQGERLVELLPRAELAVIPGEGHCPMETAPEQFNALLLEFLGK